MSQQIYCLGCDKFVIALEKGDEFGHTCSCGSTMFYAKGMFSAKENGLIPPIVFLELMAGNLPFRPHIDQFLGSALHVSPLKEQIVQVLRKQGCIWSHECENCSQKVLSEKVDEIERESKRFAA